MTDPLDWFPWMFGGTYILMGAWMLLTMHRMERRRPPAPEPPAIPETEEALRARFEELQAQARKKPGSLQLEVDLTGLTPEVARQMQEMRHAVGRLTAEQQAALALADTILAARVPTRTSLGEFRLWSLLLIGAGVVPFVLPGGALRWLGMGLGTLLIFVVPRLLMARTRNDQRRNQEIWADAACQVSRFTSYREAVLDGVLRLENTAEHLEMRETRFMKELWRGYREALEKRLAADPNGGRSGPSG